MGVSVDEKVIFMGCLAVRMKCEQGEGVINNSKFCERNMYTASKASFIYVARLVGCAFSILKISPPLFTQCKFAFLLGSI